MTDFLILGGGTAGCALASRLKEYLPSASVTLVEAGPDEHKNPLVTGPAGCFPLLNSAYAYNYKVAPQKHLGGVEMYHTGGRMLSGSSSTNFQAWTRGDRHDYDHWGKLVGDARWSYAGQLPYLRRSETHHDASDDPEVHGFDGPIHTALALERTYPLTEALRAAFDALGTRYRADVNDGDNKGISPLCESWRDGARQPAGVAYGLRGVQVITDSSVKRVLFDDARRAVGAELTSGEIIKATKEVIVSCGAIRSPQVLMLSGIGPAEELRKHGIQQILESPHVGQNLHEHLCYSLAYRVRHPERGLCALSPLFNDPSYALGLPQGYVIFEEGPVEAIKAAIAQDEGAEADDGHPLVHPPRTHYELVPTYAPVELPFQNLGIPTDGSIMSIAVCNLLPTSRGSVGLRSADPAADPLIDNNHYATHFDRVVLRAGIRRALQAMDTEPARAVVEREVGPPGFEELTTESSDADIDARMCRAPVTFFHGAGTVAMGKVLDTRCRVQGTTALRVVDASVFPLPLSCHYQAPVYALAEQMAEIIAKEHA